MRPVATIPCVAILLSMAAASALAGEKCSGSSARHRHGPPPLMLLSRKAVRDELKLTDEQSTRVREALVKQIAAFLDATDLPREERAGKLTELRKQSHETIAQILKPEQIARLRQIKLQVEGTRALLNPKTAQALKLTEEQRQKIAAIRQAARKEFGTLFTQGKVNREEIGPKMTELRRRLGEQTLTVLNDEQRAQWKELTGEPFHGDVHFWHRGSCGRHGSSQE